MPRTNPTATTTQRRKATAPKAKKPTSGIIAIDNGGHYTKIFSENMKEPVAISSKKGAGHNNFRFRTNKYEAGTYKIEYQGDIYFTGDLLQESEGEMTSFTNTKNTAYFIISALHAIALYGYDENYVVTCTPFKRFTESEVNGIMKALEGSHEITINDEEYKFDVHEVVVFPEVTPAYFIDKPEGKVHWLDFGSRTVGFATTINGQLIEKESGTIERMGLDIRRTKNFSAYISEVANELLRYWGAEEEVRVFGGGADFYPQVLTELANYFDDIYGQEDGQAKFMQVIGLLEAGKEYFLAEDEVEDDE